MSETTSATVVTPASNWGRWGEDDERGTLNLIDGQTIVQAAGLVRTGRVYRLAIPVEGKYSSPVRDGALHVSTIRHDATSSKRQVAVDVIAMHTHDFTHVDALAHVGYDEHLYNGRPLATVDHQGANQMSVDKIGAIVGRAILADIAALKGVEALKAGEVVSSDDLENALVQAGVQPRRGDILLVRTGWIKTYLAGRDAAVEGWPGLGLSTVDWLRQKEIAAVGADNLAVEVKPFEDERRSFVVHELFIRDLGGYLIEFLDLEELARDHVYESLFVMAPLRLVGGLGSPVTPVAIA